MFEVTARIKIREGEREGFKQQAAEIMRQARDKDTKTLRYDWFLSDDGIQVEVREVYLDADGLFEHNEHVREVRDQLFRDYAYDHDMSIYGQPSPALAELIERMAGHVTFNRYSLLQSLDSDIQVLDELPAQGSDEAKDLDVFEATARLKIRDGQLAGFKHHAAEIMRQMRELDEKPLRYDWFLSDDGTECEVREAYTDADSLLEHQRQIAEAKMKLSRDYLDGHTMTFYGEPSPALVAVLNSMGQTFTEFSFLQGLNSDIEVPHEVSA